MPVRELKVPDIGTVRFFKRRGTRSIRITLAPGNNVRVTMPPWVPYATGIAFVKSKQAWILSHQTIDDYLEAETVVGKAHRLRFVASNGTTEPTVRLLGNEVRITYPHQLATTSKIVQDAAKRGIYRALKQEAEALLPMRLQQLADANGFTYASVTCKPMRARWGSCSHQKDIALNIFLMQLGWELIDYVLIHELIHTRVLNHGAKFWEEFEKIVPKAKQHRKNLKNYQPSI